MALPLPSPLALQGAILALGAVVLTLTPPAEGDLLLVPLGDAAAARMLPLALATGARLVARGPMPGTLVVHGRRADLAGPLAAAGILITASPAAGCGERKGRDEER